jgi:hypothetical protein
MIHMVDLPFYAWECITIYTESREVNLVIKSQRDMKSLLEFLIISLQTIDGYRGSAAERIECVMH